jgi:class 3 adenylate cyclase
MTAALAEPRDALVTAMFVDVRGFTGFAHRTTARAAMALLDELFAIVVPLAEAHGGIVMGLVGDGALVVFGADGTPPDHADRGVEAAAEIAHAVELRMAGRCRIGIGLNSGLVFMGTVAVGAERRLAVIGDPVNVAARVEQATRDLGDAILVTEATRCLLERCAGRLVPRGAVAVRGKPDPLLVYAVRPAARRNDLRTGVA